MQDVSEKTVLENIKECAEHTHQLKDFGIEMRCPFCGYASTQWRVDRFGWPECPKCGAT